MLFEGRDLATIKSRGEFMDFMKKVQPVFQNPFETFNPLRRVEEYLFDTAINFGMAQNRRDAAPIVDEALRQVGCRWMRSASATRTSFPAGRSSGFRWRGRSSPSRA